MTLDQQVQVVHVRRRHHGRGRVRVGGGGRRYRCCCGVRVSPRYLIKETDEELYLFLLHTCLINILVVLIKNVQLFKT